MLLSCVPMCAASPTDFVPNNTGPSYSRIVAVTAFSLCLYAPTFVRESPLTRYPAVTVNASVYDVLKTRTSDTNGTPPAPVTDAATGSVTVSAQRGRAGDNKDRADRKTRRTCFDLKLASLHAKICGPVE